jgi:hypothetical protein
MSWAANHPFKPLQTPLPCWFVVMKRGLVDISFRNAALLLLATTPPLLFRNHQFNTTTTIKPNAHRVPLRSPQRNHFLSDRTLIVLP